MALFGLNWEESKWPGHFCSIVLYFFASKIGVKLPPGKKVPWHLRCPVLSSESNCHFFSKKCIFRAEKGIFSKSSFYTKTFSDPKYSFSVCKKYFFSVLKKDNIFHHSILNLGMDHVQYHSGVVSKLCHKLWCRMLHCNTGSNVWNKNIF